MYLKRLTAVVSAAVLAMLSVSSAGASAAVGDGSEIVFTDFSARFPDKFLPEGQIEKGEMSYKSHDLNLSITRHEYDRTTGDVDCDGSVTVSDAVLAMQLQCECDVQITQDGMLNADIDEDGSVTAEDISGILRWLSHDLADEDFFIAHEQVYFVVDVYVRSMNNLRGAFSYDKFPIYPDDYNNIEKLEVIAERNNAVFAINCDLCAWRSDGIVWRNGVMYRENARYVKRGYYEDVAVLFDDGELQILADEEYRALPDERKAHIWHTSHFSPTLLRDGEYVPTHQTGNILVRHPRTGIGYYEPGHYCFILAEGRQPGYAEGVLLPEFAQMFKAAGCKLAFNMDGGSSSVMSLYGSRVNHPAWNGRKNSDILYLVETGDILPDLAAQKWLAQQAAE